MTNEIRINKTDFGLKVREIRKRKHYSLRQAALQIGVSPSYLSKLENKKLDANPKPSTLDKIADGLRMDRQTVYNLAGLQIQDEPHTIAAHLDKNLSDEDIKDIKSFIDYIKHRDHSSDSDK